MEYFGRFELLRGWSEGEAKHSDPNPGPSPSPNPNPAQCLTIIDNYYLNAKRQKYAGNGAGLVRSTAPNTIPAPTPTPDPDPNVRPGP